MDKDIVVVGSIGNPGQVESATFSPLDRGDLVDVGKIVAEELEELNPVQVGYNEDSAKYAEQTKKYKDIRCKE
jgi:hypothetical protein